MSGANDWQDVLRSVFGPGLATEWLLAYLETGILTPSPRYRSDKPAEVARVRADATARQNMFNSARRLMNVNFDGYLRVIDQIPPTALDLAADFHFGYPSTRAWSPRCIWAITTGSLMLRSEIAQARYEVSAATLVSELFETETDLNSSIRRHIRRSLFQHHDAEQWLARNTDLVRPFLDPDHHGVSEAWGVFHSDTKEGLDPFLAELAVASTCRLGKLRAKVRPLARLASYEGLSPILQNQLGASNASVRKESLVLLRELVPPEELSQLVNMATELLAEDRSTAVRHELDGLKSLNLVDNQTKSISVDLEAVIPSAIKMTLEPHQISRLAVAPRYGWISPEFLSVAATIGNDGLRELSGVHLARLILAEEYLDEIHTDRVVKILGSLPNLPSLGAIHWVELNGDYIRVHRPGHTLRALSSLSASPDFENLWGQEAVVQWILANLGEVADHVRSPAIQYRIVNLYPFLLRYEQRMPEWFKQLVFSTALSGLKKLRPERRNAFGSSVVSQLIPALGAGKAQTRRLAAEWLTNLADQSAVLALQNALDTERSAPTKTAILAALAACGESTKFDLREFEAEAAKGMSRKTAVPKSLSWLSLDELPATFTSTGDPVQRSVVPWLLVNAVKTNRIEPANEAFQFAQCLEPASAAELGSHLIHHWLAADQEILSQAEAVEIADRQRVITCFFGPRVRDLHEVTAEVLSKPAGTALGSKGVLAIVAALGPPDAAELVEEYLDIWGRAFRRHQCTSLIEMLSWMDCPAAVRVVTSVAQGHPLSSIRNTALESSKRLGERLGWSDGELMDRTATGGLLGDDGTMHLAGHQTTFLAELNANLELVVTDQKTGEQFKRIPSRARVLYEDSERLRYTRLAIKRALPVEQKRMDQSALDQRRYDPRHFCDIVLQHPVLYRLAAQRQWAVDSDGRRVTICVVPGGFTDLDGQAIPLQPGSFIIQAHP